MENFSISWTHPPLDWVKLNVDGSLNPDLNSISAGGIIRDNEKNWLMGFALNKGSGSVIEAEMWGIFEGLKLAWKAGYKKVMVESDSKSVMLLLNNTTPLFHPLSNLIHACKSLMENEWSCSIHHVYKERNNVADYLAKLGHSLDLGITIFDYRPPHISSILDDDSKGVAVASSVFLLILG